MVLLISDVGVDDLGRLLISLGVLLMVVGLVLSYLPSLRLGRLPGDFVIRRESWSFHFPLATSILLSLLLTLIFWLMSWFRR